MGVVEVGVEPRAGVDRQLVDAVGRGRRLRGRLVDRHGPRVAVDGGARRHHDAGADVPRALEQVQRRGDVDRLALPRRLDRPLDVDQGGLVEDDVDARLRVSEEAAVPDVVADELGRRGDARPIACREVVDDPDVVRTNRSGAASGAMPGLRWAPPPAGKVMRGRTDGRLDRPGAERTGNLPVRESNGREARERRGRSNRPCGVCTVGRMRSFVETVIPRPRRGLRAAAPGPARRRGRPSRPRGPPRPTRRGRSSRRGWPARRRGGERGTRRRP